MNTDWEERLAEYTLGTMEAQAAAEFERSLNECREHVLLAQQYSEVVGVLGLAAAPADPPSGHRDRFVARLAATPQERQPASDATAASTSMPSLLPTRPDAIAPAPPRTDGTTGARVTDIAAYREKRGSQPVWQAVAAVAAVLLLFIAGYGWLSADKARQDAEARLAIVLQEFNVPAGSIRVAIEGTDNAPDSSAVAFVNPQTNEAFLVATGLEPLTQAEVYELWWLPKDESATPVPAGVFGTDADGTAQHEAKASADLSSYRGVAVTREQAPGATTPQGPIVLAGTYQLP